MGKADELITGRKDIFGAGLIFLLYGYVMQGSICAVERKSLPDTESTDTWS